MDNRVREIIDQIEEILNKIRPYINGEGGDLDFLGYKDGVVYLQMLGACADCGYIDLTLRDGIEEMLKEEIPEVIRVVNIEDLNSPLLNDVER
ncbi:MAG: NifU family protein [Acholeplasmatales bacterium]|nr:NifU family protein [Acholeplasmatales bacterium]